MILARSIKNVTIYRKIRNSIFLQKCWKSLVPNEPEGPCVHSEIPGPKSKKLLKELNKLQQAGTTQNFIDYQQSLGNYMVDADGNVILDLYNQISTIPVGYNHPDVISLFCDVYNIRTLINRPALGAFPNREYPCLLEHTFMSIAPRGLKHISPMMCGACANENAIKCAFIAYQIALRGGKTDFTDEERKSCMINQPPGSPKLAVMSFNGAFHGRTLATLSLTHSKDIHKLDFPAMDWPIADFPKYKYPLEEYTKENNAEDDRCVCMVEELFEKWKKKNHPVAAVIIEPIQAEGGDNHASKCFFHNLQSVVKENKAYLIIDEVQTGGGGTGTFWYHESFQLPVPPDAMTFSKKLQLGGFYYTPELYPPQPYRIFNTWMGDPGKIIILERVLEIIQRDKLLKVVKRSGKVLKNGLLELEAEFPQLVNSARGAGTFLAFSCRDPATRDGFINKLKQKGIQCGGCGELSIRFRPSLVFQEKHADIFLDIFRGILKEMKK